MRLFAVFFSIGGGLHHESEPQLDIKAPGIRLRNKKMRIQKPLGYFA